MSDYTGKAGVRKEPQQILNLAYDHELEAFKMVLEGSQLPEAPVPGATAAKTISATDTAEQMTATATDLKAGVILVAKGDNATRVMIGGSNVDATHGIPLLPGESVPLPFKDLSQVYVYGQQDDVVYVLGG